MHPPGRLATGVVGDIALTPGGPRPDTVLTRVLSELNFGPAADGMLAHGPKAKRGASATATRVVILASTTSTLTLGAARPR